MKVSLATRPVGLAAPVEPAFPYLARGISSTVYLVVGVSIEDTGDRHVVILLKKPGATDYGYLPVCFLAPLKPGEQVILEND